MGEGVAATPGRPGRGRAKAHGQLHQVPLGVWSQMQTEAQWAGGCWAGPAGRPTAQRPFWEKEVLPRHLLKLAEGRLPVFAAYAYRVPGTPAT